MQQQMLEDGTVIVLIHFIFKSPRGIIRAQGLPVKQIAQRQDSWKIACVPNMQTEDMSQRFMQQFPWIRSEDPRAVTCPQCMQSPEFKAALAKVPR
jgi:hypothetical protein